jgi:hypothetical protein
MTMDPGARRLAVAVAAVALASWASLLVFWAVGEPWGSLNDVGNAVLAVLCGALALLLRGGVPVVATIVAVVGAAVCLLGSDLVLTDTTGYVFAGLVTAVGFALIGLWLAVLGRSGGPAPVLAQVTGGLMALGLVTVPGILQGLDDLDAASWWLLAAQTVGWLATSLLLPWWGLRAGAHGDRP